MKAKRVQPTGMELRPIGGNAGPSHATRVAEVRAAISAGYSKSARLLTKSLGFEVTDAMLRDALSVRTPRRRIPK